jgi:hypothetical protein
MYQIFREVLRKGIDGIATSFELRAASFELRVLLVARS